VSVGQVCLWVMYVCESGVCELGVSEYYECLLVACAFKPGVPVYTGACGTPSTKII
jgi:hypothetical protein